MEQSAAVPDGRPGRTLRKGDLQGIPDRVRTRLVAELGRPPVGAAWRNSPHTGPEVAEARQVEAHHGEHLVEGRGTGHRAHPGAEDRPVGGRDRWLP